MTPSPDLAVLLEERDVEVEVVGVALQEVVRAVVDVPREFVVLPRLLRPVHRGLGREEGVRARVGVDVRAGGAELAQHRVHAAHDARRQCEVAHVQPDPVDRRRQAGVHRPQLCALGGREELAEYDVALGGEAVERGGGGRWRGRTCHG